MRVFQDGDGYILNGTKNWITNGPQVCVCVCVCVLVCMCEFVVGVGVRVRIYVQCQVEVACRAASQTPYPGVP